VFVAPILSGGGTKLKVLEAMAAGKAIVSTSIGVEGIEGSDQSHFVVADNAEAFSSAVLSLLDDRVFRERLGANARQRAMEKYDWEAICESISRIYQVARKEMRDVRHLRHLPT
jgi:polysaccharide biosynthesis protein PslH